MQWALRFQRSNVISTFQTRLCNLVHWEKRSLKISIDVDLFLNRVHIDSCKTQFSLNKTFFLVTEGPFWTKIKSWFQSSNVRINLQMRLCNSNQKTQELSLAINSFLNRVYIDGCKKTLLVKWNFFLVINHIFRNESKQVDTYLLLLHELDHELPKYFHLPTYLFKMCYIEYLGDKLLVWWLISCRQSFCKVVWKYNFTNIILLQECLYKTFKITVGETKKG